LDYRLFIARRYFLSRKRLSLISVFSGISVAGITIGTAVLIVVSSVLNGFFDIVRDLMVSADPHIRIVSAHTRGFSNPDSLIQILRQNPHVKTASPYVEGKAQFVFGSEQDNAVSTAPTKVVYVRGIEPATKQGQNDMASRISAGRFDLERDTSNVAGILIGSTLSSILGILPLNKGFINGHVELRSAAALEKSLTSFGFNTFPQFEVRGLYDIQPQYDESHVFIDIAEAQRLFRMSGRISGIEIRLDDLEQAASVKKQLETQLDKNKFSVLTWYDLQKTLYDTMTFEKWGASLVLALIIVVAACNSVGSLTMVVIEKKRDLGILQAMGVSRKNLRQIFLFEGLLIGGIGVTLGLLMGLGLSLIQQYFKLVPLGGGESFIISAYPIAIHAYDVILIASGVLILCIGGSVYPAYRAAQTNPVDAIRWE
jgi:lipoprotein-releasing system permease protein